MHKLKSAVCLISLFSISGNAWAANPIQLENALAGTSAWQLTNPAANREIEGYASLTSVPQGGQISFFVSTSDSSYTFAVYRMGYYAGNGARLMTSMTLAGRLQTTPASDPATGLTECNWTAATSITIPASWISGVYMVKLTGLSSGKQSYIVFIVREDARASALLFDSSVSTFEAYNNWPYPAAGGKSLYSFNSPTGAAVKVSFNRPYAIDTLSQYFPLVGSGFFLRWEYNMIRFLESAGYDVTYAGSVDLHENANLALNHKGLLLVGHDEYWSWQMRANVIAARDNGVNIGIFASNVCYWQARFENSTVNGAADRTLVGYKDLPGDPVTNACFVTKRWRNNTCVPSEEAWIGVEYIEDPVNVSMVVADPASWVLDGTGLSSGAVLPGLVGYEADGELQANSPPGTAIVMHSPIPVLNGDAQKYPFTDMATYTTAGGTTVFATGSMQFSWGLDDYGAPGQHASVVNTAAQQLTRNVLARLSNGPPAVQTPPASDAFNDSALNPSLWTFVNPGGDGSYSENAGELRLSVPAGSVHDVWTTGDASVRVMQPIGNVDFEVAVKFDSMVTSNAQMEGVIVEQDSTNFLRFDFRNDGNSPRLFAASIAGATGTFRVDIPLSRSLTPPLWLKVNRSGNVWTESWSTDGLNYTTGGFFSYTLTSNKIGPFAANYNNPASAAPALTAVIDSFSNTAKISPTPLSPSNESLVPPGTVTLSWSAVPGSTQYPVRMVDNTDSTYNSDPSKRDPRDDCGAINNYLCLNNQSQTSLNITVLAGHSYSWWVASVVNNQWNSTSPVTFSVSGSSAPVPVNPLSGSSIAAGNVTLTWNSVPGASLYPVRLVDNTDSTYNTDPAKVDARSDCGPVNNYLCINNQAGTAVTARVLSGHSYSWWVASVVNNVWTSTSPISFSVR